MTKDADAIAAGQAVLGIELGSTRIKACLLGEDASTVIATGVHEWENSLVDGYWTYALADVWAGLGAAYADLVADATQRHGVAPTRYAAIGVSAMMHGYLAFDESGELLVPFRTWRNTTTGEAAQELSELFGVAIPLRWSIAHLHQAVLSGEDHVPRIRHINTLAGHVHERLTGRNVLGVGDASGMFPIDSATGDYDAGMLARYDERVRGTALAHDVRSLLPEVLAAGRPAGALTPEGANLLDPTGALEPGVPFCPPEGDAGTGMVATNAVAPRTGNVSAGTSIFAMVVLEQPIVGVHEEIDSVTTPAGDPVAMVHCNNGASELAEWVGLFERFAQLAGGPEDSRHSGAVYDILFREALEGPADAGGLLAYNHLAGEPIAGLREGRPLFVRMPDSRLDLAGFMRAQLYGVFGTLALGMRLLEQLQHVELDRMAAHGGLIRPGGAGQRFLAAALDTPVTVTAGASEGGAWGIAVLAAYAVRGEGRTLADYLESEVFASIGATTLAPDPADVAGFAAYLDRYAAGLAIQRTAVDVLPPLGKEPA